MVNIGWLTAGEAEPIRVQRFNGEPVLLYADEAGDDDLGLLPKADLAALLARYNRKLRQGATFLLQAGINANGASGAMPQDEAESADAACLLPQREQAELTAHFGSMFRQAASYLHTTGLVPSHDEATDKLVALLPLATDAVLKSLPHAQACELIDQYDRRLAKASKLALSRLLATLPEASDETMALIPGRAMDKLQAHYARKFRREAKELLQARETMAGKLARDSVMKARGLA